MLFIVYYLGSAMQDSFLMKMKLMGTQPVNIFVRTVAFIHVFGLHDCQNEG